MEGRTRSRVELQLELSARAAPQFGLVTREQGRELGMSDRALSRLVASGQWEWRGRGLLALRAAPRSWRQELMAACLLAGPHAVVSHRSAGAMWTLDGCRPGLVEITAPHRRRSVPQVVVLHRRVDVLPADRTTIDGLPVTSLSRTVVDLAAVLDERALELALDSALRYRATSIARLRWQLSLRSGRGRKGSRALLDMVNERSRNRGRSESPLETLLLRALRQARVPAPVRQFRVFDVDGFVGRVDLAWPGVRLAVECDGYQFHSSPDAWRKDRERDNRLMAAGWTVLRPTSMDADHPSQIVRRIRSLIAPGLC